MAQEGGGGGYHFASSAGLPKLDSTLEILFVTACASQSAQTAQAEGDLLLVCRQKGTSPSSAGRRGGGSLVCYPTLGVRQTRQSDSHPHPPLGPPLRTCNNIIIYHISKLRLRLNTVLKFYRSPEISIQKKLHPAKWCTGLIERHFASAFFPISPLRLTSTEAWSDEQRRSNCLRTKVYLSAVASC